MGALVKPGCLLDTDTASGPRPLLGESFGSDVVGDTATRKNVYPEISQPVLPARYPSPREQQDSSRYVKTEIAIAFKSLSTDQGGLVNERTFPNNSQAYMDSPNRIRVHPGHVLVRNRFFKAFFQIFGSEIPIQGEKRFEIPADCLCCRQEFEGNTGVPLLGMIHPILANFIQSKSPDRVEEWAQMGTVILENMDHAALWTFKQWPLMPTCLPYALAIENRLNQSAIAPDTEIIAPDGYKLRTLLIAASGTY